MATMPVTGYCTFHITREMRVPRAERYGCNEGETFVRLGSPDQE